MKKTIILTVIGMIALNSGCVSMWTKQSWEKAQQQKAIRVDSDGQAVYVGVDLTSAAYLRDNWGPAILAGLADGALIYGAWWGVNEVIDAMDDRTGTSGDGNNTVQGDAGNNDVNLNININQN